MFSNNKDLKIQQLKQRALKSYKLNEVYKKDINSEKILSFLKSQQSIPFHKIEKILSSTSDENFPIGIIMIDIKFDKIVGFVGTFFSKRSISGKDQFFCNIHSWIVNTQHRIYSFFLISDLVKKEINLTAFTPISSLKGLLMKFGFKKTIIKEKFFLNINLLIFKKSSFKIIKNNLIKNYINNTFKNQLNEKIELKGNISKKKGLRVFKILHLSNENLFKNNYQDCLNQISSKYKIYIFSEYVLNFNEIFIPPSNLLIFNKEKDVYVKSVVNIDKNELLNSDLAF